MLRLYWDHGPAWTQVPPENNSWIGRRIFAGMQPPADATAGDLWFDSLEIVVMILVPAEGPVPGERYAPEALLLMQPFVGWMALSPVPNWRYATFLRIAKLQMRLVQLSPPFLLLDPRRILNGNPTDPVSNLTCPEALLFASWFGKGLCGQDEWLAAARLSPQSLAAKLLGSLHREWAGPYSEGVYAVVTPFNIDKNWDELYEDERSQEEMFRRMAGSFRSEFSDESPLPVWLSERAVAGPRRDGGREIDGSVKAQRLSSNNRLCQDIIIWSDFVQRIVSPELNQLVESQSDPGTIEA